MSGERDPVGMPSHRPGVCIRAPGGACHRAPLLATAVFTRALPELSQPVDSLPFTITRSPPCWQTTSSFDTRPTLFARSCGSEK